MATACGLTNVSFRQCAADALPFGNDSLDVVVSRLGTMFFPEPLAALRDVASNKAGRRGDAGRLA
jgi:ubiquinone/menaquinone biosynthesis C-methylase UbiE